MHTYRGLEQQDLVSPLREVEEVAPQPPDHDLLQQSTQGLELLQVLSKKVNVTAAVSDTVAWDKGEH